MTVPAFVAPSVHALLVYTVYTTVPLALAVSLVSVAASETFVLASTVEVERLVESVVEGAVAAATMHALCAAG